MCFGLLFVVSCISSYVYICAVCDCALLVCVIDLLLCVVRCGYVCGFGFVVCVVRCWSVFFSLYICI